MNIFTINRVASTTAFVAVFSFFSAAKALTPVQQQWVDAHNEYRRNHQVGDVTWSEAVAQSAQNYANQCPTPAIGHSSTNNGENLAWAFPSQTISNVLQRWYDEVQYYDFDNPGEKKSSAPQDAQIGHFTQIVWKDTTEIGCAIKDNCEGQYPSVAVCQYSPPGNLIFLNIGRAQSYRNNVFPAKTTPENYVLHTSFESNN